MPKSIQKATDLQESDSKYEEFLKGLSLISVGLRGCSASLDRTGLYELWEKKKALRDFKDSYRITKIEATFFEAAGSFVVTVRESADSEPVVTVKCEFEAHLHAAEPIPKNLVQRFVDSAFQLILVPYARQFVSTTTAQMSIPPLVIPLSIRSSKNATAKKSKGVRAKAR